MLHFEGVDRLYLNLYEPPRISRKLHFLKRWSYEYVNTLFPGSSETGRASATGGTAETQRVVDSDGLNIGQDRWYGRDAAAMGSPGGQGPR